MHTLPVYDKKICVMILFLDLVDTHTYFLHQPLLQMVGLSMPIVDKHLIQFQGENYLFNTKNNSAGKWSEPHSVRMVVHFLLLLLFWFDKTAFQNIKTVRWTAKIDSIANLRHQFLIWFRFSNDLASCSQSVHSLDLFINIFTPEYE